MDEFLCYACEDDDHLECYSVMCACICNNTNIPYEMDLEPSDTNEEFG